MKKKINENVKDELKKLGLLNEDSEWASLKKYAAEYYDHISKAQSALTVIRKESKNGELSKLCKDIYSKLDDLRYDLIASIKK
jgi:hypothetical protein